MTRGARIKGSTGIYHVMARGNNKNNIFFDSEDYKTYINMLKYANKKYNSSIYAYCLMPNHIHIVINENESELSEIIKNVNSNYAQYINNKYKRIGHLFQGRYKSEPIEDEKYLFSAIRYVHNNPMKAGKVKELLIYEWSSYNNYINNDNKIIEIDMLLNKFSGNRQEAINEFKKFSEQGDNALLIDEDISKEYLKEIVLNIKQDIINNEKISPDKAEEILVQRLINDHNIQQKVLSEILGISLFIIRKIIRI